jgi:hypothetical protein
VLEIAIEHKFPEFFTEEESFGSIEYPVKIE